MKRLLDGSFKTAVKPYAQQFLKPRSVTKPTIYPLAQTFVLDKQKLTPEIYADQINEVVNIYKPCSFRGISSLPPILPGSINAFVHIGFETEKSEIYGLYSKSNNFPISILCGDRVLVLNKLLWETVDENYKEGKEVVRDVVVNYASFEKDYTFDLLASSIDAIASMEDHGGETSLSSALSRLISMVTYSCRWLKVRKFFEGVIADKDEWFVLGDEVIELIESWGRISRQVHDGKQVFGEVGTGIRGLRETMFLIDSKSESRHVVGEEIKEVNKWCNVEDLAGNIDEKFNLIVKVLSTRVIKEKGMAVSESNWRWASRDSNLRLSHCVIADSTASIVFKAVNEQVDLLVAGTTVVLLGASIEWKQATKFVIVDQWGSVVDNHLLVEDFEAKEEPNLSEE